MENLPRVLCSKRALGTPGDLWNKLAKIARLRHRGGLVAAPSGKIFLVNGKSFANSASLSATGGGSSSPPPTSPGSARTPPTATAGVTRVRGSRVGTGGGGSSRRGASGAGTWTSVGARTSGALPARACTPEVRGRPHPAPNTNTTNATRSALRHQAFILCPLSHHTKAGQAGAPRTDTLDGTRHER